MSTQARTVAVPELLARIVYAWGIAVVAAVVVGILAVGSLYVGRRVLKGYATQDFTN